MVIMDHRLNDILEKFSNHEIYIWSNYGFNPTSDLDLKFVGEVNGNIAESLWYYHWENLEPIKLDITLYHDTKIIEHIPRINRCKRDIYYFDEELGYERELKYCQNQKTCFVDEMKGDQRLSHIVFRGGALFVEKEKTILQKMKRV